MKKSEWDVLVLDLDGTLLCKQGEVSSQNLHALDSVRDYGIEVVVAAGRCFRECRHILKNIQHQGVCITAGGSQLTGSKGNALASDTVNQKVVEDNPLLAPQIYPSEFAKRAGLSVVEPCNPDEVLHCSLAAANISDSTSEAVVLIAHHSLLSSSSTIDRSLSEELQHYRQAESMSPIRLGRKFELNKQRSLPSPGEKMSVGFVIVGMSNPWHVFPPSKCVQSTILSHKDWTSFWGGR